MRAVDRSPAVSAARAKSFSASAAAESEVKPAGTTDGDGVLFPVAVAAGDGEHADEEAEDARANDVGVTISMQASTDELADDNPKCDVMDEESDGSAPGVKVAAPVAIGASKLDAPVDKYRRRDAA